MENLGLTASANLQTQPLSSARQVRVFLRLGLVYLVPNHVPQSVNSL